MTLQLSNEHVQSTILSKKQKISINGFKFDSYCINKI